MSTPEDNAAALRALLREAACSSFELGYVFRDGDGAKAFAFAAARAGHHVEFAERFRSKGVWDVVATLFAPREEAGDLCAALDALAQTQGGQPHGRLAAAA